MYMVRNLTFLEVLYKIDRRDSAKNKVVSSGHLTLKTGPNLFGSLVPQNGCSTHILNLYYEWTEWVHNTCFKSVFIMNGQNGCSTKVLNVYYE